MGDYCCSHGFHWCIKLNVFFKRTLVFNNCVNNCMATAVQPRCYESNGDPSINVVITSLLPVEGDIVSSVCVCDVLEI